MTLLEKALGIFVVVLVLTAAGFAFLYHRAQGQTRHAALHADSLAAALDTSHAVALSRRDSIKILGDSMQAVSRRVFQVAPKNDALDRALGLQRVAIAALTVQVQALSARVTSAGPVTTDSATGARSATFSIDSTPYHGTAAVWLPVSGQGTMDLNVALERAAIALRLGCGAKTDGIRSASATLTGPPWLALELGRVEQTPELCNPTTSRPGFVRRLISSCGVSAGYGFVLAGGRVANGPGAMASCKLWP